MKLIAPSVTLHAYEVRFEPRPAQENRPETRHALTGEFDLTVTNYNIRDARYYLSCELDDPDARENVGGPPRLAIPGFRFEVTHSASDGRGRYVPLKGNQLAGADPHSQRCTVTLRVDRKPAAPAGRYLLRLKVEEVMTGGGIAGQDATGDKGMPSVEPYVLVAYLYPYGDEDGAPVVPAVLSLGDQWGGLLPPKEKGKRRAALTVTLYNGANDWRYFDLGRLPAAEPGAQCVAVPPANPHSKQPGKREFPVVVGWDASEANEEFQMDAYLRADELVSPGRWAVRPHSAPMRAYYQSPNKHTFREMEGWFLPWLKGLWARVCAFFRAIRDINQETQQKLLRLLAVVVLGLFLIGVLSRVWATGINEAKVKLMSSNVDPGGKLQFEGKWMAGAKVLIRSLNSPNPDDAVYELEMNLGKPGPSNVQYLDGVRRVKTAGDWGWVQIERKYNGQQIQVSVQRTHPAARWTFLELKPSGKGTVQVGTPPPAPNPPSVSSLAGTRALGAVVRIRGKNLGTKGIVELNGDEVPAQFRGDEVTFTVPKTRQNGEMVSVRVLPFEGEELDAGGFLVHVPGKPAPKPKTTQQIAQERGKRIGSWRGGGQTGQTATGARASLDSRRAGAQTGETAEPPVDLGPASRAYRLLLDGDMEQALKEADAVLADAPDPEPLALAVKGYALFHMKRREEALEAVKPIDTEKETPAAAVALLVQTLDRAENPAPPPAPEGEPGAAPPPDGAQDGGGAGEKPDDLILGRGGTIKENGFNQAALRSPRLLLPHLHLLQLYMAVGFYAEAEDYFEIALTETGVKMAEFNCGFFRNILEEGKNRGGLAGRTFQQMEGRLARRGVLP